MFYLIKNLSGEVIDNIEAENDLTALMAAQEKHGPDVLVEVEKEV